MMPGDLQHVWEDLRDELRKLRGRNQFRGNEEHLLLKREIRIPMENRGDTLHRSVLILHLTPRHDDLWAEQLPEGTRMAVTDFGGDWREWLGAVVARCRGNAYLHTSSTHAHYRKASAPQEESTEKK